MSYTKPQYFCAWSGGDVFTFWQISPSLTIMFIKSVMAWQQSALVAAWMKKSSTKAHIRATGRPFLWKPTYPWPHFGLNLPLVSAVLQVFSIHFTGLKTSLSDLNISKKPSPNRQAMEGEHTDPMGRPAYHRCSPVVGWMMPSRSRSSPRVG